MNLIFAYIIYEIVVKKKIEFQKINETKKSKIYVKCKISFFRYIKTVLVLATCKYKIIRYRISD